MNTLHVLYETFTNGYTALSLDFISLVAIVSGILVIISKNPVVSVLFLIGLFLSISGYLLVLGINFIGLSYLLVYVGAVSILFLFILMLINVRISELLSNTSNSIPLAILVTIAFYYLLYPVLPYSITASNYSSTYSNIRLTDLGGLVNYSDYIRQQVINRIKHITDNDHIPYCTSKSWDKNLAETSDITAIGNIIYTSHMIWLILVSLILILAMVGAIVITIKQKETIVVKPSNNNSKSQVF